MEVRIELNDSNMRDPRDLVGIWKIAKQEKKSLVVLKDRRIMCMWKLRKFNFLDGKDDFLTLS